MHFKNYAYSKYANYAHVYMYAVFFAFEDVMREIGLIGKIDYELDVTIDGNLVKWEFQSNNEDAIAKYEELIRKNKLNFSPEMLKVAVGKVALTLEREVAVCELDTLATELKNVEVIDIDDDLDSPKLGFDKGKAPFLAEITFSGEKDGELVKYYISAICQELSSLSEKQLFLLEDRVILVKSSKEISLDKLVKITNEAIANLKQKAFAKKLATKLKISQDEAESRLSSITISI